MADHGRRAALLWAGLGTVAAIDFYFYYHAKVCIFVSMRISLAFAVSEGSEGISTVEVD